MNCEYREDGNCIVFTRKAGAPFRCDMPEELKYRCPIAVSQTGDRSFAQAQTEYHQIVPRYVQLD